MRASQNKISLMAVMLMAGGCFSMEFYLVAPSPEISNAWHAAPLAVESVLYTLPYPEDLYLQTPGLAVCPNGRLITTFYLQGSPAVYNTIPEVSSDGRCFIYTSDNGGVSWTHRANTRIYDAKPIVAGNKVYLIGRYQNIRIAESSDWGGTWSSYHELTSGQEWFGSANNALVRGDNLYLVMDRRVYNLCSNSLPVAEYETTVVRGNTQTDLTNPANWTFSESAPFADRIDDQSIQTLFGLSAYPAYYPNQYLLPATSRYVSPMGLSDGNLVEIVDPHHYFYASNTVHILSRANTGLTNVGGLLKMIQTTSGGMEISMQKSPSGRDMLFMPLPGGQQPFYVLYDEISKLYWLLSTESTDSMTKAEYLDSSRAGAPFEESRRLHLWFSKNLYDWCSAGPVAIGATEKQSRRNPSMAVYGNDLIFVCLSGNAAAICADRCNQITFSKINDFRSLVY